LPGSDSMQVFWQIGLARGIEEIARLGFDAIEIWVSHFEKETDLTTDRLAKLLKEAGLACTIHAPIRDINIASVNEGIRRESMAQQIEAVKLCAALGGELVVVHPGQRSSKRNDLDEQWEYQADSYRQILEEAKAHGVTVTVENMEWEKENELVGTAEDIQRLQGMVGDSHLPVTLDLTHVADTTRIIEAIDTLENDIIHVHVSDFGEKRHIPLGEGTLDFPRIFQELMGKGFSGILSFEIFIPGSSQALKQEKEKLLTFF